MLQILQEGDKILQKKAKRIHKIDDTIRNIASNMVDAMIANNGIGLAGNQVGILKRIIVVMVNEQPKVMVNPEVILTSEIICKESEGCLSFPNQFYDIERPQTVTVKYRNLSGHPVLETYSDLVARCILHEIDHLDGIVFTQRKRDEQV